MRSRGPLDTPARWPATRRATPTRSRRSLQSGACASSVATGDSGSTVDLISAATGDNVSNVDLLRFQAALVANSLTASIISSIVKERGETLRAISQKF